MFNSAAVELTPSRIFNSAAVLVTFVPPMSSVVTDISPATVAIPSAKVIKSVSSVCPIVVPLIRTSSISNEPPLINPVVVIADEPVSALDVSIQAQVINLMMDLQEEFNLTILFIAHDLSVVKHISTSIAVMYQGELVEFGKTEAIFSNPQHVYTKTLLAAIPLPNPKGREQRKLDRL